VRNGSWTLPPRSEIEVAVSVRITMEELARMPEPQMRAILLGIANVLAASSEAGVGVKGEGE
jgi:hypothetical protein